MPINQKLMTTVGALVPHSVANNQLNFIKENKQQADFSEYNGSLDCHISHELITVKSPCN